MKIFYSWQSDLENKFNRSFIKEALREAIEELNLDLSINEPERQIQLDHDTKNVPGTPDLVNTIFEKIASSTIFIADISFVAERNNAKEHKLSKKLPNPNVLIELGYALSKLGSNKVIYVLNTATGALEDLPFDLRHKRGPIHYCLDAASTDKAAQKTKLVSTLKDAIKLIVSMDSHKKPELSLPLNPSKQDIIEAIMSSDSEDDWEKINFKSKETIYYKKNVSLRFEIEFNEKGTQRKNFQESWANKHPDPYATGYWCHLLYNTTCIDIYTLVSVDGGRAHLPLPNTGNELIVNPLFYKVAQIHDSLGTLDQYMIRSGLILENTDLAKKCRQS